MTLRLILSPDPDRDLPDPGEEREDCPACRTCGEPVEDPRHKDCDECHWGPQDRQDDHEDEPDDAREPLED